jgi:putative addiction module component (TIGR02574 family)
MERLESEVLSLPHEDRARLAQLILVSLEEDAADADSENVERAWAEEIGRRVAEVRSGAVKLIPGDEVFKEIEDLIK